MTRLRFISLHSGLCLWQWRRPSRDARTVVPGRVGGVRAALRRWRWREYSQDIRETNVSSQRNSGTHSMFRMNGERLFALVRGIGTLFLCFKLMENDCLLTDDEEHHFDDFGYKKNLQPPAERVRGKSI